MYVLAKEIMTWICRDCLFEDLCHLETVICAFDELKNYSGSGQCCSTSNDSHFVLPQMAYIFGLSQFQYPPCTSGVTEATFIDIAKHGRAAAGSGPGESNK